MLGTWLIWSRLFFVAIFPIYVVMTRTTSWFVFIPQTCDMSKHMFFWSGSSKKVIIFHFDHFKHSLWSKKSGYEYKICGHEYHMILYGTIGLLYIKTHIYEVWKLKKTLYFNFDHLKHSMWSSNRGHEHKICGHEYHMILYGTIGSLYKTHIYEVWKLKKNITF